MIHLLSRLKEDFHGILRALGLVFGDIGTSPIYTLTIVFLLIEPTYENVLGVLSLVIWTMTLLVTFEYAFLAMSLAQRGEGGIIVLRSVLLPLLKSEKSLVFFSILTFIGISLLIGDGVITPAISILSAVEGIVLIPGLEGLSQKTLLVIASTITIFLFFFQRKGTDRVADAFGPIMLFWFGWLLFSRLSAIKLSPEVFCG